MRKFYWIGLRGRSSTRHEMLAAQSGVVSDLRWAQVRSVYSGEPNASRVLILRDSVKLHLLTPVLLPPVLATGRTARISRRHSDQLQTPSRTYIPPVKVNDSCHFAGKIVPQSNFARSSQLPSDPCDVNWKTVCGQSFFLFFSFLFFF